MAGIGGGRFGQMVNDVFVETGLGSGYQGNNPNRGAFNKARSQRRRKAKERRSAYETQTNGYGVSGAATGGMAQWS